MAIRLKARSTTPGAVRLADNVLSQLIGVADIRKGVQRGDNNLGTLTGCVDSAGANQGTTGILAVGTFYANGTLSSAGAYNATGVIYGAGSYATEASRNSTTAAAGDIVSGKSVTIAGSTTNGTLDLSLYTLTSTVVSDITAAVGGILTSVTLYSVSGRYVIPTKAGYSSLAPGYGYNGSTTGTLAAAKIRDATYGTLADGSVLVASGGTYVDPADADVKLGTAIGVSPRAGTWDAVTKTDVVAAAYVVVGHDRWTGGAAGEYPTTATSQAAQLEADKATVLLSAEWIVSGHSILGQAGTFDISGYTLIATITWPATDEVDGGVTYGIANERTGTGVNATTAQAAAAAALAAYNTTGVAKEATLGKLAPRLIGTLSGAGTGTEICIYSGVTVTYTVDDDGNITNVAFS